MAIVVRQIFSEILKILLSVRMESTISFIAPRNPLFNLMPQTFPQEVIDDLIDWVGLSSAGHGDPDLRACSLVAGNWVERSRQHLFRSIKLASSLDVTRWVEKIHPGADGPSKYVRKLWIHFGWDKWPQRFPSVEHLKSFAQVEELRLTYWCGGGATKEEVEEAFGSLGQSVKTLTVSLLRGDAGSFLHFLSLFPRLDDLSIMTSYLEVATEPLPEGVVTIRGSLVLDGVQERFVDALVGSGLTPKVLKVTIPNLTSYDGLLAACSPSVEMVSLSPTFGACLDHTSLAGFTALRHVEIKLTHPKCFFADVHTVLRPVPSPHLEKVTFNFSQNILRADLEKPGTVETWINADDVLYELSTRWPQRKLLLVIKGKFDPKSPIKDLAGTMSNLLPKFMDVGMVGTEVSVDTPRWPEHGM